VKKGILARWRSNFLTGLAVLLPGVISIAVVVWLFRNVSDLTDRLLLVLPPELTHANQGKGSLYWYWSLFALALAIAGISAFGLLARNYIGKKILEWMDAALLHVPFLNKIYSATKQVNDALTSGNKESFKTVVLIEYPRPGVHSLAFLTSEDNPEVDARTGQKRVCVFVPTTPNPTAGFLLFVPECQVTRLEMSVPDGIKYIISLGSLVPAFSPSRRSH
jgi:uncharacterized membrane protein